MAVAAIRHSAWVKSHTAAGLQPLAIFAALHKTGMFMCAVAGTEQNDGNGTQPQGRHY
jgi:hypothetical protein